jgi:MFS family permease
VSASGWAIARPLRLLDEALGGPARRRVIVILAGVLGLESADVAAVGALATELERSLGIGDAELGLMVTVPILAGALATIPAGVLVDRTDRTRILAVSVTLWAVTMAGGGLAGSFATLLTTRIALGVVTATAGPAVASLTGDLFPPGERAAVSSRILTGQLVGAGVGFLVVGNAAAVLSWRAGFWVLAVPAAVLAVALWRLPEPARGGRSRLEQGATELVPAGPAREDPTPDEPAEAARDDDLVQREVAEAGARPDPDHVLHGDLRDMPLGRAVRYVLSVRTNIFLIAASGLIYFFLTGLQTFAVEFLRGRYDLGQSLASTMVVLIGAGAIGGVLVAGRLADNLLRGGRATARLIVAAAACLVAAIAFVPSFVLPSLVAALPFQVLAVAALAATNPPLDAARLDVNPALLWGRAEAVRTTVRAVLVAFAPLTFGLLSEAFGGGKASLGGGGPNAVAPDAGHGLVVAFTVLLVSLLMAGALLVAARRPYPTDVASAAASEGGLA